MRIMIKKSVADQICRYWGLPLVKSVKTRRERFLQIKAELLKHCKQKLREAQAEEAALRKAIIGWERLEKAAGKKPREKAENGAIRTWSNGKKYRRVAPGKWVRVYQGAEEAESKGGVRAWKNIIKKLKAIDDERELMWFVQQNRMRFIDNAGYPLSVVEKLSELASVRNDEIVARKDAAAKQSESTDAGKEASGGEPSKTTKTSGIDLIRQKYGATRAVDGDDDEITLPDGSTVAGRWRIVEASAPSASHDEITLRKTKGFPTNADGTTINDRDYEHDRDAQEAVLEMAANYDARAVSMDNPVVVSQDGVVISGNNRTMSSKLAAKKGSDEKYIDALKKRCKRFGVDPAELDKFTHPRVVFETEVKEGYSTKQFAAFNASDKKAQSPVEQAVKVAKIVRQETVEAIAQKMDEYDTLGELYTDKIAMRGIFNSLCDGGVIQKTDVPAYYTEDYGVSDNGKEFLETVLIGSVMTANNIRTLAIPGGKAIRQKLVRAIVPLVENKGMKGYSISNELNEAVRIACYVAQHRKEMPSVATYAQQQSLFGDKHDVLAIELAKKLDNKSVTQKEFASLMQSMNAGLRPSANGEVDIFLGRAETRGEILSRFFGVNIEKGLRKLPRFMVRKSVARQALRAPLPRLAFGKSGSIVVRR